MVRTRYGDPQRLAKYAAGAASYAGDWQHIDVMMRGVVKANSGGDSIALNRAGRTTRQFSVRERYLPAPAAAAAVMSSSCSRWIAE